MNKGTNRRGSDWKGGFLFLGNNLALDFLNTRPVQNGRPLELIPDFNALLRWFHVAGPINARQMATLRRRWGKSILTRGTVNAARKLREKLREQVLAWESGATLRRATVDELNRLMADHPMLTRLTTLQNAPIKELWFDLKQPADLLAPLAHSAATLFAESDRTRIRKCGQCVLHFLDTSKKGTRHWCSMRLFGNRFKVAAYTARQ
jgi:predicted RNA-binding Zn ribbon-like protein